MKRLYGYYKYNNEKNLCEIVLCTCDRCKERGMYEVFFYRAYSYEYVDCVKLNELNLYVDFISTDIIKVIERIFNKWKEC